MRSTASRWLPFQSRASKRRGARRVIARNSALYSAKALAIRRAASRARCVPKGGAGCACGSVKIGRQLRVKPVLIETLDLRSQDPSGGELGERVHGEELHGVGLAAHGRGAAGELAEEEELVNVVEAGGVWMAELVDQSGELHGPGAVPGFLEDLARHGAGGGVVD